MNKIYLTENIKVLFLAVLLPKAILKIWLKLVIYLTSFSA